MREITLVDLANHTQHLCTLGHACVADFFGDFPAGNLLVQIKEIRRNLVALQMCNKSEGRVVPVFPVWVRFRELRILPTVLLSESGQGKLAPPDRMSGHSHRLEIEYRWFELTHQASTNDRFQVSNSMGVLLSSVSLIILRIIYCQIFRYFESLPGPW